MVSISPQGQKTNYQLNEGDESIEIITVKLMYEQSPLGHITSVKINLRRKLLHETYASHWPCTSYFSLLLKLISIHGAR